MGFAFGTPVKEGGSAPLSRVTCAGASYLDVVPFPSKLAHPTVDHDIDAAPLLICQLLAQASQCLTCARTHDKDSFPLVCRLWLLSLSRDIVSTTHAASWVKGFMVEGLGGDRGEGFPKP